MIATESFSASFYVRQLVRRERPVEGCDALDRPDQVVGRGDRAGGEAGVESLEERDDALLLFDPLAEAFDVQLDHAMGREVGRVEAGANYVEAEPELAIVT